MRSIAAVVGVADSLWRIISNGVAQFLQESFVNKIFWIGVLTRIQVVMLFVICVLS